MEIIILVGIKIQNFMVMVNMFLQVEQLKKDYLKMVFSNHSEMFHMTKQQNMLNHLMNKITLLKNEMNT